MQSGGVAGLTRKQLILIACGAVAVWCIFTYGGRTGTTGGAAGPRVDTPAQPVQPPAPQPPQQTQAAAPAVFIPLLANGMVVADDSGPSGPNQRMRAYKDCGLHGSVFLFRCFCDAGWTGVDCTERDAALQLNPTATASCDETGANDACWYHPTYGVGRVTHRRWLAAQNGELDTWITKLSQVTDDRSTEHITGFGNYAALPYNLGDIIEVGCGPFTQLRALLQVRTHKVRSVTLSDPLLLHYFAKVPNCYYRGGTFGSYPSSFLACGAEALNYYESFDTLIMMNVVEHTENVYAVLNRIWQALRPGGYLVLHERVYDRYVPGQRNYVIDGWVLEHPIRIKTPVLAYFMRFFDIDYVVTPGVVKRNLNVHSDEPNEEGVYLIARKRSLASIRATGDLPDENDGEPTAVPTQPVVQTLPPLIESFFLAWTTANEPEPWRWLIVGSIFHYHPQAKVIIYCSPQLTYENAAVAEFKSNGFDIELRAFDLTELCVDTPLEAWSKREAEWAKGPYWYSHKTDAFRYAVLYKYGGVYLDFDTILMRPLTDIRNAIGRQDVNLVAVGFLTFPPHHMAVTLCANWFTAAYDPAVWACVGPDLMTRAIAHMKQLSADLVVERKFAAPGDINAMRSVVNVYAASTIYPVHWRVATDDKYITPSADGIAYLDEITPNAISYHVYTKMFAVKKIPVAFVAGSFIGELVRRHCGSSTQFILNLQSQHVAAAVSDDPTSSVPV